jgi:hypothetical protein
LDSSNILIRFEHIYQKNEDPTFSQPAMIDFNGLFPIFNITKVQELGLASTSVLNSNGKVLFLKTIS